MSFSKLSEILRKHVWKLLTIQLFLFSLILTGMNHDLQEKDLAMCRDMCDLIDGQVKRWSYGNCACQVDQNQIVLDDGIKINDYIGNIVYIGEIRHKIDNR